MGSESSRVASRESRALSRVASRVASREWSRSGRSVQRPRTSGPETMQAVPVPSRRGRRYENQAVPQRSFAAGPPQGEAARGGAAIKPHPSDAPVT